MKKRIKTSLVRIPEYQWKKLKAEAIDRVLTLSKYLEEIIQNK